MFKDATLPEIDRVMENAWKAFHEYRKFSLKQRAAFMRAIALELEACGDALIEMTMQETALPEVRLRGERARTIFQLNSYALACEKGEWLGASIDTAIPDKVPPKPDIRKMLVPLGPVIVFGASNFPYAYSTAGGDTACALAAGCPVIVKAHPAHAGTSTMVAGAILKAAEKSKMPEGIFSHVYGNGFEVGKALVMHPHTKAVGFTGSYGGGKQLFDWGNQRKEPIPVFAEMGSINPVVLLPEKLASSGNDLAKMLAGSITLGVGQFCTNPGLIIGIESEALQAFKLQLGNEIKQMVPGVMLHTGIASAYSKKKSIALDQPTVITIAEAAVPAAENQGAPAVAAVSGKAFLNNPVLHQEVFGPYSLVVGCADAVELLQVIKHLEGQLTTTLMATPTDLLQHQELVEWMKDICGRFIVNNVPTGVEVCLSMQHGGPFPSTTDSRYSSVGADGIKRFARPLAFQNWPNDFLPEELKKENPLGIWRMVNSEWSRENG